MKKNNKRNLSRAIIFVLILSFSFLIWQLYLDYKLSLIKDRKQSGVPEFAFFDLEDNIITKKTLPENSTVCFLKLDLDCSLCETLVEELKITDNKVNDFFFIVVAKGKKHALRSLQKEMKLNSVNNVLITHDPKNNFDEIFGLHPTPFLIAYNAHGSIIKKYTVSIKLSAVLADIKKTK
uniref:Alkyl hydroperoxide reductase subunit C/ Thiol specific antioxidant domain-containing protein n=1 Tax=Sphingobacterium sp. (strain 21) TaxID=743722 RepID=F4C8Y1_SPHS2